MFRGETDERGYPKAPDTFIRTTGDEGNIDETQKVFFDAITKFLGYPENTRGILYEIEDHWVFPAGWLVDGTERMIGEGNTLKDGRSTDFSVTILTISSQRIIAYATRWRTGYNHIQAIFGHCLNPELVEQVRFKMWDDSDQFQ